ncbi:MAG: ornithine/acetylornithine aminotransferase [Acidimicrobiaceae bacterium]|jgi:ornithine--oxo-acid transaminase|nr:ornithine/acetylornithine aminotransferase [Acidimicrobiaceae bacterium]
MSFDLRDVLDRRTGENFELYARNLNPQIVRVLKTIGFDRRYVRADGCYLYDESGDRFLDLLSGFGVFALGRSHPVIKKALHDALDADLASLVQMDAPLLAGVLAEELLKRTHPGMGRVVFTNSGAEAVEAATKFARFATKRKRVLYCDHAFHGLTYGALSLNGGKEFRKGFGPYLPGFDQVPFGDAEALERELQKRDVAAFVVEPIQGKGVNVAPSSYWDSVQELCRRYGTLFVADEVQTGLGRTGKLWAYEHWGLVPDIVTTSKALSGGYVPVGAMICSTEVSDRVYSSMDRALVHSSTFKNNTLAMVAGLATLQTIDDEDLVDRARVTGEAFSKGLAPLLERYELFHLVRGEGLMIGLVFGEPRSPGVRSRYRLLELAHKGLFSQLIVGPLFQRHRILTQVAGDSMNVIKLLPPLVAGQDEVDYFLEAFDDVLGSAHKSSSLVDFAVTLAKGALRRDH